MEKTYKTTSVANLSKTIIINKTEVLIDFLGGALFPIFKSGKFTTSNKEIQDALENSNGYGINYIQDILDIQVSTNAKKLKLKIVKNIQTKQLALEWISNNLKKEFSYQDNDSVIKEFVQSNGYTINWE